METTVRTGLTKSEGRRFGLPVGFAFWALTGLMLWRGHQTPAIVFGLLGGALLVGGVLIPSRLGPVYRAWMAFALAISKVTTPVFMGVVFFSVITPIGLLMRLLGKNPLLRERNKEGYWIGRRTGQARTGDMKRQF